MENAEVASKRLLPEADGKGCKTVLVQKDEKSHEDAGDQPAREPSTGRLVVVLLALWLGVLLVPLGQFLVSPHRSGPQMQAC